MANTALRRGSQEEGNSDYFTGCPIGGGFIWFGLPDKIPSNCRICDNSTLAISSFAKLYENLGGAWGQSGGSMNIPDLRGRFPRGVDGGIGNDPDRATRAAANAGGNAGDAVGSVQADENKPHAHFTHASDNPNNTPTNSTNSLAGGIFSIGSFRYSTLAATQSPSSTSNGNESRPKNANVYFVIRVE
jgi:microcystin-dependent protein